jgi:hypothetical protein
MASDHRTRRAAIHLATALIYLAIGCAVGLLLAGRASATTTGHGGRAESLTETLHLPAVTILAFGDVQQQPAVFSRLLDHTLPAADYLLGVGDYTQNSTGPEWISFAQAFSGRNLSRLQDIALSRGNHEPLGWWASWAPLWFQRSWGGLVALVVIDSGEEVPIRYSLLGGGAQREWLRGVTRSAAWTSGLRVVAFHHPHRTELWDGGCYYPRRQELEETMALLMAAGVDLVICGHAHGYQRGRLPNGGLLVITGGGGGYLDVWCRDEVEIDVALAVHHVLLIEASDTALVVRAIGADGREIDRVTR